MAMDDDEVERMYEAKLAYDQEKQQKAENDEVRPYRPFA